MAKNKYQFALIFFLLIIITGSFGFTQSKSISLKNDNNQLEIGEIKLDITKIEWNGRAVEHDSTVVYKLKEGENLFVIYQNENLACLTQFIYKRTSSKIHLSSRIIIEKIDGKRYFNSLNKKSFKTDPSYQKVFSGNLTDIVTYDKKTMSTVKASFTYQIK